MNEESEKYTGIDPMTGNFIKPEQNERSEEKIADSEGKLRKAMEFMETGDFQVFKKIIEQKNEDGSSALFDMHGKALHTTNSFSFEKILGDGALSTKANKDGLYQTPGASFTNGDSEVAAVFQTIIDDQNSRSNEKRLNTQKYFDKTKEFIEYFWKEDENGMREYLKRISGSEVNSIDDAIAAANTFKYKATPKEIESNPDELGTLFGVTVAFDKEKLPELTSEGTGGMQNKFELRSYQPEGVPLSQASTVFVPETQIPMMKQKLQELGFKHILVKSSEELEAIRLAKILESS